MKASITGHTYGIGRAIKDFLEFRGYECQGFSSSNGFDIGKKDIRQKIIELSLSSDIFVNNATTWTDDSQFELLEGIWKNWRFDREKTIINVSSIAADFANLPNFQYPNYALLKEKQDIFCKHRPREPWIINLKPGNVDTPHTMHKNDPNFPKMKVDVIPKILAFALDNREEFKISSITFQL